MDISYLLLSIVFYLLTLYVSKRLSYINSTFLIPSSADLALGIALLSLFFFHQINMLFMIVTALVVSLVIRGASGRQVVYLKALAYTMTILLMPMLSYDLYEYAKSMLTGFLFVNSNMLIFLIASAAVTIVLFIFDRNLLMSIFDLEYAEFVGLRPNLWLSLLAFDSALLGFGMTLSYGFLLAHVVALAASSSKKPTLSAPLFTLALLATSFWVAAPLACAVAAVVARGAEVLLLRLGSSWKVRSLFEASLRASLSKVPCL